jgi:hypothetical protein
VNYFLLTPDPNIETPEDLQQKTHSCNLCRAQFGQKAHLVDHCKSRHVGSGLGDTQNDSSKAEGNNHPISPGPEANGPSEPDVRC